MLTEKNFVDTAVSNAPCAKEKDYHIVYSNPNPYQLELHGPLCQDPTPVNYQDIDEVAGNKAETNKKHVARDYWGSEYSTTAIVGAED